MKARWISLWLSALLAIACSSPAPLPLPQPTAVGKPTPANLGPQPTTNQTGGETAEPSSDGVAVAETPACSLLFKTEVATAVGTSVEEAQDAGGNSDETGWLSDCLYWRHNYHDQAPLELTLSSGSSSAQRFAEIAAGPDVAPLSGVGDEALLQVSSIWGIEQPLSSLFVRAGATYLGFNLGIVGVGDDGTLIAPGDSATQQQALIDLANIAIKRLTGPPEPAAQTCQLLSLADASALTGDAFTAAADVDEHDTLGPSCQYKTADDRVALLISVNSAPIAQDNFAKCRQTGQIVLGVADAAFIGESDCRDVMVGFYPLEPVLYAKAGDTILTVGQYSTHNNNESPDPVAAVARKILAQLGLNVGATPAPVAANVLAHACVLATSAEVQSIIGEAITSTEERDPTQNAGISECEFHSTPDGRYVPFDLNLKTGQEALNQWGTYHTYAKGDKVPLAGIGDEAFSEQVAGYDESQPTIVNLYVLSGQAVLELRMGVAKQSADYLTYLAPGTPEEQLQMLRQLAELILPRLYSPPS